MKFLAFLAVVAATAQAHTIFQKVSVNGADQGALNGVRHPTSNNVRFCLQ
jgi:cellulase